MISACGGGGGGGFSGGGFASADSGAARPTAAADGTTTANGDSNVAVGAGGTGAPVGGGGTVVLPPVPVYTSDLGKAIQSGLYAVSYGMGSANGQPDKSIWKSGFSTLYSYTTVDMTAYAGNDQLGNNVVSEAMRPPFDPDSTGGIASASPRVRYDDATSQLIASMVTATDLVPLQAWNVTLEQFDIAGTSIQDYLVTNRSLTKPIAGLSVAGSFGVGSKAYRIHYTAPAASFIFGWQDAFITSESDFATSSACGVASDASSRLALQIHANGTIDFLQIAQGTGCTPSILAAGTPAGTGSWVHKVIGAVEYEEITFPVGVSPYLFDPAFLESEYAAGVSLVVMKSNAGRWSSGYLVPQGVSFQSRDLSLNFAAAASLKTVTGM